MLNLKNVLQSNGSFKNLVREQCLSVSYARVKYTPPPQFYGFTKDTNSLHDISILHTNRKFVHSSNISFIDIGYKDYVKKIKEGMKIVDVRNPSEIKNTGRVQGSLNIPLDQLKQAFTLSPDEWKEKYKQGKPSENTPIMVICAGGVRSKEGVKILQQLGYRHPMSYRGGYRMFKDKK